MTGQVPLDVAATKLRAPAPPRGAVERPSLVAALEQAVSDPAVRLVLVSAPVGSGKSTLLSQWAATTGRPVGWLQVDEADSDPARFWTQLALAADVAAPGLAAAVVPAVAATGGDASVVVPRLVNALDTAGAVTVVVDDYHLVTSEAVHAGLDRLVELAPPGVTVVLAARFDPPLRLGRMRVRRSMAELRAADLCFDDAESGALLAGFGALTPQQVTALRACTEGWAAGLVLAGLSLRGTGDAAGFVARFEGADRLVADYLADELLDGLDPADRHRLVRTSVLDELSGPLVDAVCDTTDGTTWLATVASTNQLVVALDTTGTWYRYHHLLRDLLRLDAEGLPADELAGLHHRAAEWLVAAGRPDDAIEHALAAGRPRWAAELVAASANRLLNAGRFATLVRYLGALGEEAERHAGCAATAGWLQLSLGRWDDARRWLGLALEAAGGDPGDPAVAPLAITAELTAGDVGAALRVARAVADRPEPPPTARLAMMAGGAFVLAGLAGEGGGLLARAEALAVAEPDHYAEVVTPVFGAIAALDAGDAARAGQLATLAADRVAAYGNGGAPLACFTDGILGLVADDADERIALVRRCVETARQGPENFFGAFPLAWAADVLCAAGEPDGPERLAQAVRLVGACPDAGAVGAHVARLASRERVAGPTATDTAAIELTDRELALLRHLPTELTQREIAGELYVSINTVKTHARSLYRKLGVEGRAEAVVRARQLGLL